MMLNQRAADRGGKQPEVEVPPAHARHCRQHLPLEVILQHRRLAARRLGAAAVRVLAQSAFVDEDERPPLVSGFFLISGQRFCSHCWIFTSSRSSARPAGLGTPFQVPQDAPDVARVIFHGAFPFDQARDTRRCPQTGSIAQPFRPLLEPALDLLQILQTRPCAPAVLR